MRYIDSDVDIEMLAQAYRDNEAMRAAIDYLAARDREPRKRETRARGLRNSMAKQLDVTLEDVLGVLELFEKSGCGEVKAGRPKEETRLIWAPNVSALDTARSIQKVSQTAPNAEDRLTHDQLYESHDFPVRPGVVMPLRLRKDLTADELNNLAEFVRVVARARMSA